MNTQETLRSWLVRRGYKPDTKSFTTAYNKSRSRMIELAQEIAADSILERNQLDRCASEGHLYNCKCGLHITARINRNKESYVWVSGTPFRMPDVDLVWGGFGQLSLNTRIEQWFDKVLPEYQPAPVIVDAVEFVPAGWPRW